MPDSHAPIRILTVDDHLLLREGIAAVIAGQEDMVMAGEAATGQQAVERYRSLRPDITLMDLQMPDMSGLEALRAIRRDAPEARIIVLTTYDGDVLAQQCLDAGAAGYLLKSMLRKELLDSIRAVHAGRRHVPPQIAVGLAEHRGDDRLTEREVHVLELVASGHTNRAIAAALTIAEETVKSHVKHILAKLSANDRTHAVSIALRRGILGR